MIYIVTGSTGFVGNNVVKKLEASGQKVIAFAQSGEKAAKALGNTEAKLLFGNIKRPENIERLFDECYGEKNVCFIHTASVVYLGRNRKKLAQMREINIKCTKNIIEACLEHKCRLLYVSSVHAIKENPKREVITETENFDPKKVVGHYAKTKAEASRLIMEAVKERGLDAVIVHPSGIIGINDYSDTHLTQMVADYRSGRIPACTGGGYDFVDVRDVADGIIAAAAKGKAGDCFLLTNKFYSARELFNILYELGAGKKVRLKLPLWMAYMGLPFLGVYFKLRNRRPLYTAYSLYTLKSNGNFSHEKATRELGYNPRSLRESIQDMLEEN